MVQNLIILNENSNRFLIFREACLKVSAKELSKCKALSWVSLENGTFSNSFLTLYKL